MQRAYGNCCRHDATIAGYVLPPSPPARQPSVTLMPTAYLLAAALLITATGPAAAAGYAWRGPDAGPIETLERRVAPPPGFARMPAVPGSFAAWLRGLPLKPTGSPVLLHTGAAKARQDVHAAVIDIDVGKSDLQQCADAAMRLRAEWQFASGRPAEIAFNDTGSARPMAFSNWAAGGRPRAVGSTLVWSRGAAADAGYGSFRRYMDAVFTYAGTHSLARELASVPVADLQAGDLFIKGGFPGHAVLVADVVDNGASGEKRFLLVQSYMPAQSIHLLKNPEAGDGSPWYPRDFGDLLVTPEWTFARESLKRWKG